MPYACHTVLAPNKLIWSFSDPRSQAQMSKISVLHTTVKIWKGIIKPTAKTDFFGRESNLKKKSGQSIFSQLRN